MDERVRGPGSESLPGVLCCAVPGKSSQAHPHLVQSFHHRMPSVRVSNFKNNSKTTPTPTAKHKIRYQKKCPVVPTKTKPPLPRRGGRGGRLLIIRRLGADKKEEAKRSRGKKPRLQLECVKDKTGGSTALVPRCRRPERKMGSGPSFSGGPVASLKTSGIRDKRKATAAHPANEPHGHTPSPIVSAA